MNIALHNITLQRGNRVLIADFNLELTHGDGISLRGPNGSGKTTLLRTLAGLHSPLHGTITGLDRDEDETPIVSFLGHIDPIKAGEKLRDQFEFWADLYGAPRKAMDVIAEQTGLTRQMDLQGGVLSAGQRRRASLARLLLEDRPVWLLDEPAAPLDQEGRAILGSLLDAHRSGGGVFIAAVHDDLPGLPTRNIELVAP
jgi:heme exporter protein A